LPLTPELLKKIVTKTQTKFNDTGELKSVLAQVVLAPTALDLL
jgi:hypothetical protein